MKLKKKLEMLIASIALVMPLFLNKSNVSKVHASMPDPYIYYSKGRNYGAYYDFIYNHYRNHFVLGKIPVELRKKGSELSLYKGKSFSKQAREISKQTHKINMFSTLHRDGHTYYDEYWPNGDKAKINGHRRTFYGVYIDSRDIGKKARQTERVLDRQPNHLTYAPLHHLVRHYKRVHHYHIIYRGVSKGWTTNRRYYTSRMHNLKRQVQHARRSKIAKAKRTKRMILKKRSRISKRRKAKRTHRYHITYDGINGGYTNSYSAYKSNLNAIKKAVQIHKQNQAYQAQQEAEKKQANKRKTNQMSNSAQQQDAVKQVNGYRSEYGQNALQENGDLDKIAQRRADRMASGSEQFAHVDPNNNEAYFDEDGDALGLGDTNSWLNKYYHWGENIAQNQSAQSGNNDMMYHDADSGWGHRKNILSPDYTQLGTGYNNGYLVEDFA